MEKLFDWSKFLSREDVGFTYMEGSIVWKGYTDEEIINAVRLSTSWKTCVTSALCESIPRDSKTSAPVDQTLRNFDRQFAEQMRYVWHSFLDQNEEEFNKARKLCLETLELIRDQIIVVLKQVKDEEKEKVNKG